MWKTTATATASFAGGPARITRSTLKRIANIRTQQTYNGVTLAAVTVVIKRGKGVECKAAQATVTEVKAKVARAKPDHAAAANPKAECGADCADAKICFNERGYAWIGGSLRCSPEGHRV